jgi:hypothetical protein
MEFDLSHADRSSPAVRGVTRAVFFCFVLGVPLIFLATDFSVKWTDSVDIGITIVSLAWAPPFTYLAIYKAGPSPTRLVIDDSGVSFVYPSGALLRRHWSDPDFELRFRDVRFTQYNLEHPGRQYYDIRFFPGGLRWSDGPITVESYEYLTATALAKGMEITPSDWSEPDGGARNVVVRAPKPSR